MAGGIRHLPDRRRAGRWLSLDAGLIAQYAVIALAVLASIGVVMRKQFPNATGRLRIALALPLLENMP